MLSCKFLVPEHPGTSPGNIKALINSSKEKKNPMELWNTLQTKKFLEGDESFIHENFIRSKIISDEKTCPTLIGPNDGAKIFG